MPIKIEITYPKASETVTQGDLDVLNRFDAVIKENIVVIAFSSSNCRWEHESQYKSDRYYSLISNGDNKTLGTYGITWLSKTTPDEFIQKLDHEQVFPDN